MREECLMRQQRRACHMKPSAGNPVIGWRLKAYSASGCFSLRAIESVMNADRSTQLRPGFCHWSVQRMSQPDGARSTCKCVAPCAIRGLYSAAVVPHKLRKVPLRHPRDRVVQYTEGHAREKVPRRFAARIDDLATLRRIGGRHRRALCAAFTLRRPLRAALRRHARGGGGVTN